MPLANTYSDYTDSDDADDIGELPRTDRYNWNDFQDVSSEQPHAEPHEWNDFDTDMAYLLSAAAGGAPDDYPARPNRQPSRLRKLVRSLWRGISGTVGSGMLLHPDDAVRLSSPVHLPRNATEVVHMSAARVEQGGSKHVTPAAMMELSARRRGSPQAQAGSGDTTQYIDPDNQPSERF